MLSTGTEVVASKLGLKGLAAFEQSNGGGLGKRNEVGPPHSCYKSDVINITMTSLRKPFMLN